MQTLYILLLLFQPREAVLSSLLPLVPTAGSVKPGNRFLPSCLLAKCFQEHWSGAAMRLDKPWLGGGGSSKIPVVYTRSRKIQVFATAYLGRRVRGVDQWSFFSELLIPCSGFCHSQSSSSLSSGGGRSKPSLLTFGSSHLSFSLSFLG